MTEGQVATILGISHTTFSKKLNGKAKFDLGEAIMLAKLVNTTLDDIFLKSPA